MFWFHSIGNEERKKQETVSLNRLTTRWVKGDSIIPRKRFRHTYLRLFTNIVSSQKHALTPRTHLQSETLRFSATFISGGTDDRRIKGLWAWEVQPLCHWHENDKISSKSDFFRSTVGWGRAGVGDVRGTCGVGRRNLVLVLLYCGRGESSLGVSAKLAFKLAFKFLIASVLANNSFCAFKFCARNWRSSGVQALPQRRHPPSAKALTWWT
jgi:hypothetical protein